MVWMHSLEVYVSKTQAPKNHVLMVFRGDAFGKWLGCMPEWLRAWREIPMASSVLWKPRRRHAEFHACSLSPCDTLHMSQCIKKALSMSHADAAILLLSSPSPELLLSKFTSILKVPLPLVFTYSIRKQTLPWIMETISSSLSTMYIRGWPINAWNIEAWRCDLWLEVTS